MKRIIIITLSASLLLGIVLLWLGNSQNSPTVSANTRDLNALHVADTLAYRWEAMAKKHVTSQGSSAKELAASNLNIVEMQHSLPGREIFKIESDSRDRGPDAFDAGPWYNGGSEDRVLDAYDAGHWYNGD